MYDSCRSIKTRTMGQALADVFGRRWGAAVVVALVGCPSPRSAFAAPDGPRFPEPLLGESATDVDAAEAGEVEVEANLARIRAARGAANANYASLEVEWRVWKELGVRLEPSYAWATDSSSSHDKGFGGAGTVALGLLHDRRRQWHLQFELSGRLDNGTEVQDFEPGETALPYSANLVGAARSGRFTFRTTIGGEVGGSFAYAPAHTDFALLSTFTKDGRFGFFGLEVRADWARTAPLVLAPEAVADLNPLGLPFRLGVAVPVNVGAAPADPLYGFFLRLQFETDAD